MTNIRAYRNKENRLTGFAVEGHADYGAPGYDIVCAAVSAISIATVNGLQVAAGRMVDVEEGDGVLRYRIRGRPTVAATAILRTAELAYQQIAEQYNNNVQYDSSES